MSAQLTLETRPNFCRFFEKGNFPRNRDKRKQITSIREYRNCMYVRQRLINNFNLNVKTDYKELTYLKEYEDYS